MNSKLNSPLFKAVTWLLAEILLNFVGLDNLADYSEFVFERHLEINPIALVQTTSSSIF